MKKLLVPILFLYLVCSIRPILAQEKEEIRNGNAFHFYFINDYALSYKFKSTSSSSFRLILEVNSQVDNTNTDATSTSTNENTVTQIQERESNSFGIDLSLSPQYMWRFAETEYANLYFGGGPLFGYSYEKGDYESTTRNEQNESISKNNYTYHSERVGLGTFIGVEGSITNNVTVFAETKLEGGMRWSSEETDQEGIQPDYQYKSNSTIDSDGWFANFNYIRIGVGIYF